MKGQWTTSIKATVLVAGLGAASGADAADRYLYYDGSAAYYCDAPAQLAEHYYVIRDEPNVVRVNGYPVMNSGRAATLCSSAPHPAPVDSCCDPSPAGDRCMSVLVKPCHCPGKPNNTPIACPPGKLKEVCKTEHYYERIGVIKGTIPVPQICTVAKEEFQFRNKVLDFDCDDPDGVGQGCEDVNCDHSDCTGPCRVKSCEVYNKRDYCKKTCEMCPREGELLIAVRRGGRVADVFIGRPGKPYFPEYPANLVVIRGRTQADIQRLLGNSGIDFNLVPKGTDLIANLCP